MDVVERYLENVRTYLPGGREEDLVAELRENIRAQVEDREERLGRPLGEEERIAVLRAHGHPLVVAGRYRSDGRRLVLGTEVIGPALFPFFRISVLAVAAITALVLAFGGAWSLVFGARPFPFFRTAVLMLSVQLCVATAVFAAMEAWFRRTAQTWDPRRLPIPTRRTRTPGRLRVDAAFQLVFTGIVLWIWLSYPDPLVFMGRAHDLLRAGPAWRPLYLGILLSTCLSLATPVLTLLQPEWRKFRWIRLALLVRRFHRARRCLALERRMGRARLQPVGAGGGRPRRADQHRDHLRPGAHDLLHGRRYRVRGGARGVAGASPGPDAGRLTMDTFRIALANLPYPASPEESVALAVDAIARAGVERAGLICFPERFVPGYRAPGRSVPPHDPAFLERAWAAVRTAAAAAEVAVILGTERQVGDDLRIDGPRRRPERRHPGLAGQGATLIPSEDGNFSPGTERRVFRLGALTFGVVICHEGWRYPETVRWAVRHGAQVVFHPHFSWAEPGAYRPTAFADPANTFHEKALGCRAAENTCYFASVNCAEDGASTTSAVAGPDGNAIAWQPYGKAGLLVVDLDLSLATGFLARRCRTFLAPEVEGPATG